MWLALQANHLLHMNEVCVLHRRNRTERVSIASAWARPRISENSVGGPRKILQWSSIISRRGAASTKDRGQPTPAGYRRAAADGSSTLFDIVVARTGQESVGSLASK